MCIVALHCSSSLVSYEKQLHDDDSTTLHYIALLFCTISNSSLGYGVGWFVDLLIRRPVEPIVDLIRE